MSTTPDHGKILIVDDTPENLTVLRKMLAGQGYNVRPAINGEIALKSIRSDPPDLILLDIIMPEMDGYEVCAILKSSEETRHIPVIFISALSETEDIVKAFRAGGVDYITKPFQAEEVLSRVGTQIALHNAMREKKTAHDMLETILASIENTIVTVDGDLTIINANKPLGQICSGGHPGEDMFKPQPEKNPGPCTETLLKTLETGKPVKERRVRCDCGGKRDRTLVLNTAPLPSGKALPEGAVLVIRDISRMVRLEKKLVADNSFHSIIGKHEKMREVFSLLERTAELDINMLICGESGTGKELIAEAIHRESSRSEGPLVKANCAALSENLLESELFGHVKGAFTGAVKDRVGRFQMAEGGTLFLDEIGEISPAFQAKLLRFLEYREFERIGDSKTLKADVRVVAATNRDLAAMVEEKTFRQDLFYRLKGIMIQLPPLRERGDDIGLLTTHFVRLLSESMGRQISGVSDGVERFFLRHPWPGNVRELKTTLHHACALCTGELIEMDHLPQDLVSADVPSRPAAAVTPSAPAPLSGQETEKERILAVLEQTDWNKAKSARLLKISRATLYTKILKYGLTPES
ncbi:MAG: sigma 54-interacting transcriptional regulator [Desulfobacterales bacterium]|nr:sigma 54-interacting transcriptional regulator [Desulfobacterales bacterium]